MVVATRWAHHRDINGTLLGIMEINRDVTAPHPCRAHPARGSPEGVVLTLTDDGAGTDSQESGPGHPGIATVRARAQADGAELTIDSRPGAGTRVSLRIPAGPPLG